MKYGLTVLASPDAPLAQSGGQTGVGAGAEAPNPRAVLAAMIAQRELPPAPVTKDSPTVAAEAAPEELPPAVAEGEPGQEISSLPETESQEEVTAQAGTESGDETETDLSQGAGTGAATPAEWAKLSPTERKSALELVKQFQAGEIPRIAKLVAQKHTLEQTTEHLQKQVEELQQQVETAQATPVVAGASPLPEPVAKLKTVAEVQGRLDKVQADAEALTDFLDANPGDAQTTYQIGQEEFTRQQLIERRAALRQEARLLPQRGQQIVTAQQFAEARKQFAAQVVQEHPILADPDHPDAKVARQLAKLPQFANEVNGDYLALAVAIGDRTLKAQAAQRKAGVKPAVKPQGNIPTGKPHSASNAGGVKTPAGSAAAAMSRHQKEGSKGSFAALLSATGR